MNKTVRISTCCHSKVSLIPPSMGEPGIWVCEECKTTHINHYPATELKYYKLKNGIWRLNPNF